MNNNELTHWGVKGQKWGVRRYQNPDGTLTPAGKKRYDKDVKELSKKDKARYKQDPEQWAKDHADPNKWVKEDLSRSKKLLEESNTLNRELQRQTDTAAKRQPKERADLSHMTDKELREKINREYMERQYNDLFTPQRSTRGRDFIKSTLETTGNVLAIGASALGIALAVKELRG